MSIARGTIAMYAGYYTGVWDEEGEYWDWDYHDDIPCGWAKCDGNNGTPDLSNRFIVGAGNAYNIGDTGGVPYQRMNVKHKHGLTELSTTVSGANRHAIKAKSQAFAGGSANFGLWFPSNTAAGPAHTHYGWIYSPAGQGEHWHKGIVDATTGAPNYTQSSSYQEYTSMALVNQPAYIVLGFIMKL